MIKKIKIKSLRSLILNLYFFKSWKHVIIGKNVTIKGKCFFDRNINLYNNVEVRSGKAEIYIGNNCSINRNTLVLGKVIINKDVSIAPNCVLIGSNHIFEDINIAIKKQGIVAKGIIVEDDVWIGANCVVLDGVTIGQGCVIGAGSVVSKSIPSYSVAVGNPCRVIKNRLSES